MPRVQCRFGDPQTEVSRDAHRGEFRCIEPRAGLRQCASNRPMGGRFIGSAATQPGASRMDPHKLPSSISYGTIQLRRRRIFGNHPRLIERGLLQVKDARQNGANPNKDCRRPYHEGLPEFPGFAGISAESPSRGFVTASVTGPAWLSASSALLSRILLARWGAASCRAGPGGNIEVVCDRADRWLFTSDFLMRLREAPVDRLRA